jgi:hypothetical protein
MIRFVVCEATMSFKNTIDLNVCNASYKILIEFNNWRQGKSAPTFRTSLFELIVKAHPKDRSKIKICYPQEVAAWSMWEESGSDAAFDLALRGHRIVNDAYERKKRKAA